LVVGAVRIEALHLRFEKTSTSSFTNFFSLAFFFFCMPFFLLLAFLFFIFGFGTHKLARQVQQERTQMEVQ